MSPRQERWILGAIVLLFLLVQLLPFLVAYNTAGPDHVFGGFLLNPYDGNSYLAKMRQGLDGAWQFTLPYTAQPGEPTAINLYYLLLGHLARWTNLPLIVVFHAARLVGALFLCFALYRFLSGIFANPEARLAAFGTALFGSGFGWLAAAFGGFTADFWWAEAYPFLTAYVNPHFVLGLAIQLWLLTPAIADDHPDRRQILLWLIGAAVLSVLYPFGWAATLCIIGGWFVWQVWRRSEWRGELARMAAVAFGGAPYAIYAYLIVKGHPVLSQWDAQNLAPTPAVWEVAMAFFPVVLIAIIGTLLAFKRRDVNYQYLAIWVIVTAVAIYAPAYLQRRLATGFYIPMVGLAIYAIWQLSRSFVRKFALLGLLLLSLPTNAIVVAGGIAAVGNHDPLLTIFSSEAGAFDWLDANAPKGALVLAAPQTGLFLPAHASVHVLFGHWFETANAIERRDELSAFFGVMDDTEAMSYIDAMGVDYIFYGPRERDLGTLPNLADWRVVFGDGDLQIWSNP